MEPWMFSVQLASHVTVLSCRTSFQWWPAGGTGTRASLSMKRDSKKEYVCVCVCKQSQHWQATASYRGSSLPSTSVWHHYQKVQTQHARLLEVNKWCKTIILERCTALTYHISEVAYRKQIHFVKIQTLQCITNICTAVNMDTPCRILRNTGICILKRFKYFPCVSKLLNTLCTAVFFAVHPARRSHQLGFQQLGWWWCFSKSCFSSDQPLFMHHYTFTNLCMKLDPFAALSLAAVDDDVIWLDPFLQHALFGMLASAPEQPRRLNLKVADALFVVVQQTVAVLIHYLLVGLFQSLQQK